MRTIGQAPEVRLEWIAADGDVAEIVAMRRAIYGGELGWIDEGSDVAWDRYDLHSTTLLVRIDGRPAASSRLTIEDAGPLEVSDLVDWRSAVPAELRAGLAAEWSRVMILTEHRGGGWFRRMYDAAVGEARRRGARLLAGASEERQRARYASLGFTYVERPFRSPFFDDSPVYLPAWQRIDEAP